MNFAHPEGWLLLLLIPVVVGIFTLRDKRAKERLLRFADAPLLPNIQISPVSSQTQVGRRIAWSIAILFCLAAALSRPQIGYQWGKADRSGIDIIVAIDVSSSMLSQDVRPSRLERARRKIVDLVRRLKGDRIGLVAFSGDAFLETPLTYDYSAFLNFVKMISPDFIPLPGTNIEAALRTSIQALKQRSGEKPVTGEGATVAERGKAIVLLTDGEDFSGNLEEARRLAAENKIRIYIFGVGTEKGGPIPEGRGYKKDRDGKMILTRLRPEMLEQLAKQTGGIYVESIGTSEDASLIYDRGMKQVLEESSLEGDRGKVWNEYFQIPLGLAALLLLIGGRFDE